MLGTAAQAPFEGRVALFRLYSCDTIANAKQKPTDLLWPSNNPVSYSVSSWADFATKYNNNTILVRKKNFKRAGVLADFSTLATPADRVQWWTDFIASPATPTGDTVTFAAGTYDIGTTDLLGNLYGINLASSGSVVLDAADAMPSAWTQPDAGGAPKVWQYGTAGNVGRCVWIDNGDGTRVQFIPTFGASFAAVKAALQAREYSVFTDSGGVTYVALPTGIDPNTLTFRGSKAVPTINLTGVCMVNGTFMFVGGAKYDFTQLATPYSRAVQNTPTADFTFSSLTVISAGFFETSKHGFTAAANGSSGAIFRYRCSYGKAPPALSGGSNEYGVPAGNSLDVDFSGVASTSGSPGSAVFAHYYPTITDAVAVEGTTGGRAFISPECVCYAHGGGGATDAFAYGITTGCTAIHWWAFDNTVPANIDSIVTNVVFA
jgi:hypothetical protein